jgi:hypothetical protein
MKALAHKTWTPSARSPDTSYPRARQERDNRRVAPRVVRGVAKSFQTLPIRFAVHTYSTHVRLIRCSAADFSGRCRQGTRDSGTSPVSLLGFFGSADNAGRARCENGSRAAV